MYLCCLQHLKKLLPVEKAETWNCTAAIPFLSLVFRWGWYLRWGLGPFQGVTQFSWMSPLHTGSAHVIKLLIVFLQKKQSHGWILPLLEESGFFTSPSEAGGKERLAGRTLWCCLSETPLEGRLAPERGPCPPQPTDNVHVCLNP